MEAANLLENPPEARPEIPPEARPEISPEVHPKIPPEKFTTVGAACVPCATCAVCAACAAGAHTGHLMAYSDNSFEHDHTAHNHSNRNTLQNGGDDNAHNWVPQSDPMSSSVTAFFSDLG
ncbi:hypothetical protein F2Q69_00006468 [Brassica cretica]|uniref:Uncharacterized protein n=1 Tax=Brassica cretica TaxID=69181 RepID=A0A8S9P9D8_BRACR|nr:hypothetical protein F2Q69_00006468 [Brassica cretica]